MHTTHVRLLVALCLTVSFATACAVDETDGDVDTDVAADPADTDVDSRSVITEELGPADPEIGVIYSASGDCSHGGIDVYEHEAYGGASHFFCIGDFADLRLYKQDLGWGATWNDRISSASVNGKVRVVVYEHPNYGGNYKVFYPYQLVHLGGTIWNDAISSMKVRYYPY